MDTWKTAYVFVSSTFKDMYAERDYLSRIIFPSLKLSAALYKIHLEEIDLRDGLTEWKVSGNEAIKFCKEMIDKCRPFFICILGDRYGWVPLGFDKSITHLEVEHAFINPINKNTILFLFRDHKVYNTIPAERRIQTYIEQEPDFVDKQISLKAFIRNKKYPIFDGYPTTWNNAIYCWGSFSNGRLTGFDEFGNYIKINLWENIKKIFSLPNLPDLVEDFLHRDIENNIIVINESSKSFIERNGLLSQIKETLISSSILALFGTVGSGKTTMLAMLSKEIYDNPDTIVITNFPSATVFSKNIRYVLWKFCRSIENDLEIKLIDSTTTDDLLNRFYFSILHYRKDKKLLLIIDSLDEYEDEGGLLPNCFLPPELPNNVKIIFSLSPTEAIRHSWLPEFNKNNVMSMYILPLNREERKQLIKEQLPMWPFHLLGSENEEALLRMSSSENPLCLKLTFNFISSSSDFNSINNRIEHIKMINSEKVIERIVNIILDNLEKKYGSELVKEFFSILSVGRGNFNELELNEILTVVHPKADLLLPILFEMRRYLPRKWGKVEPLHCEILSIAKRRYFYGTYPLMKTHRIISNYYFSQDNYVFPEPTKEYSIPNYRKIEELPWHLYNAKMVFELDQLTKSPIWRDLRRKYLSPVVANEDIIFFEKLKENH